MGFFSRLRGEKALTASAGVLEAAHTRQLNSYISLGGTNEAQGRISGVYVAMQNGSYGWIYRTQPAARRVINYLSGQIAQLGLKLYERVDDNEREQVGDHPAAQALRRPNPHTPGKSFIKAFVKCFLVWDNAYALKIRGADGRLILVGLSPSMVGIIGQSHFAADGYRIYRADGTYFDVEPRDMLHWRGENPDDPRRGESNLETLREELALDGVNRQAASELARSGLVLPGWIERPLEAPEWSEEARKRFEEDWANRAKSGKRRTPVIEEGMVFKSGGVTPEDAELQSGRRFAMEYVASLYGMKNVPPETDEERRQFNTDVLPDYTGQFADFLNLQILEQEYGLDDHYFEFNLDDKLMGDERIKTLTSAAGAPIMLRDEARSKLNLPPLPDGQGEEVIVPANVTEGGKPSIGTMPIQDPNKPSQDGDFRSGEADQPDRAGSQSSLEIEAKAKPLQPSRRLQYERRDAWGYKYRDVFGNHFQRQQRVFKSRKATRPDDDRWNKELADDLLAVSRDHFSAEGSNMAFRMNFAFDAEQGDNWLAAKAEGSAIAVNRITRQHIEQNGAEETFKQALEVRAAAAGMAYATDVAGFSTKAAIQQDPSGDRTVVIDGGTCDVCAPHQGEHAFDEVEWPGYHQNCGCVAQPKSLEPQTKQMEVLELVATFVQATQEDRERWRELVKAVAERPAPEPPTIIIEPAETHFHENAIKAETEVHPPNVDMKIQRGAFIVDSPVTVEPSPVTIAEGAVKNTTHVDASIAEGAVQNTTEASEVNVKSPDMTVAPEIQLPAPPQPRLLRKKVIRDENNRITEIEHVYEGEE